MGKQKAERQWCGKEESKYGRTSSRKKGTFGIFSFSVPENIGATL
jgi:hypothetical protein